MKKNNFVILIISFTFFFIFIKVVVLDKSVSENPIPAEYIDKKKDKQKFKKNRKDWVENMHRTHPDDNWKEIDKENRSFNSKNRIGIRKKYGSNIASQIGDIEYICLLYTSPSPRD